MITNKALHSLANFSWTLFPKSGNKVRENFQKLMNNWLKICPKNINSFLTNKTAIFYGLRSWQFAIDCANSGLYRSPKSFLFAIDSVDELFYEIPQVFIDKITRKNVDYNHAHSISVASLQKNICKIQKQIQIKRRWILIKSARFKVFTRQCQSTRFR